MTDTEASIAHPTYEAARLRALRRDIATRYKNPTSRWEISFVPLGDGKVKEVGLSVAGEIQEGFTWQLCKGKIIIVN